MSRAAQACSCTRVRDPRQGAIYGSLILVVMSMLAPPPLSCGHAQLLRRTRLGDRLVCGLRSKQMQRRILEEDYIKELPSERLLRVCAAYESSATTESNLRRHGTDYTVGALALSAYKKGQRRNLLQRTDGPSCKYCGGDLHPREQCKSLGKTCRICSKVGHFADVCSRRSAAALHEEATVGYLYLNQTGCSNRLLEVGVTCDDMSASRVLWLPDTGADIDAIGLSDLDKIDPSLKQNLALPSAEVHAANGAKLNSLGTLPADLEVNGRSYSSTLHVFQDLKTPLLSKTSCIGLCLIEDGWPHSRLSQGHLANRLSIHGESGDQMVAAPSTSLPADVNLERIKGDLIAEFPEACPEATPGHGGQGRD